jgi:hypothetical protein
MSDDQHGDQHQQNLGPDPDRKQAHNDPPNEPRQEFQPVVIKGGQSEVSAEDLLWERLIRLGVRAGGPSFPKVMRQRLRELFLGWTRRRSTASRGATSDPGCVKMRPNVRRWEWPGLRLSVCR